VTSCKPKQFAHFKFCESIYIGWIDLSEEEIKQIVVLLASVWSALPRHIIRHNCLQFAEALVERIGLIENFPGWLTNACVTANGTPGIVSLVDSAYGLINRCSEIFQREYSCQPDKCCVNCHPYNCHPYTVCFSERLFPDEKIVE